MREPGSTNGEPNESWVHAGTGVVDLTLLMVTVVWGLSNVAVKHALGQFLPMSFNALRFLSASVAALTAVRLSTGRLLFPRADLLQLAFVGFLGNVVFQVGFIKGLSLSTAGNVSFVMATIPATTAIISHILGLERLRWRAWLGFGVALAGAITISVSAGGHLTLGAQTVRGDLLVLAGTLGWCMYIILSKRLLARYQPLELTAWTMALGAVGLAVVGIPDLLRQDWARPDGLAWAITVGSALALVLGYVVWNWGMTRIGVARTSLFSNVIPLWGGFFGWLLLGEKWLPAQLLGAALVLAGVAVVRANPGEPAAAGATALQAGAVPTQKGGESDGATRQG